MGQLSVHLVWIGLHKLRPLLFGSMTRPTLVSVRVLLPLLYLCIGLVVGLVESSGAKARSVKPSSFIVYTRWDPAAPRLEVDLFRMKPNGSAPENLTHDHIDGSPSVSPRGGAIVFSRGGSGESSQIYRIGTDGKHLRQLTRATRFEDRYPVWSPTGDVVVFSSNRQDGEWVDYVMNPDGGKVRLLTGRVSPLGRVAFSPTGLRVAVPSLSLLKMKSNGRGSIHKLARSITPQTATPAWSPANQLIAFVRMRQCGPDCDEPSIYVVRPDGTGERRLIAGAAAPAWSPDGRSLLFVRETGNHCCSHIFRFDLKTRHAVDLTPAEKARLGAPVWAASN